MMLEDFAIPCAMLIIILAFWGIDIGNITN